MGNKFMQQNRSSTTQTLKNVSSLKAIRYIAAKTPGKNTPEEIEQLDRDIHTGDYFVLEDRFFIRDADRDGFQRVENLLSEGKPRRAAQITTGKLESDLRCWYQNNTKLQSDYPEVFHISHLLRPRDDDSELYDLNLRYQLLAVSTNLDDYREMGLIDDQLLPTEALLETLDTFPRNSALSDFVDQDSPLLPLPLTHLPNEQWQAGAIQSLYLDYLTGCLVALVCESSGRYLDRLSPSLKRLCQSVPFIPSADLETQLQKLGSELDKHNKQHHSTNERSQ